MKIWWLNNWFNETYTNQSIWIMNQPVKISQKPVDVSQKPVDVSIKQTPIDWSVKWWAFPESSSVMSTIQRTWNLVKAFLS